MMRSYRGYLAVFIVLSLCLGTLRLWPHAHLRDSLPNSTALYAKNGELLRLTTAVDGQYRLWVPLTEIDPRLVEAVQLYEDRWFSWHIGVNPIALIPAGFATYHGKVRQGGSTITMQLARRLYRIHSQMLSGKLQQLAAAMWLEARYSKHEILEAYLNLAPYGGSYSAKPTQTRRYARAVYFAILGYGTGASLATLAETLS